MLSSGSERYALQLQTVGGNLQKEVLHDDALSTFEMSGKLFFKPACHKLPVMVHEAWLVHR